MQRKMKKSKIGEIKTKSLDNFNDNNKEHNVSHFLNS